MGVFTKIDELVKGGLPFEEALKRASEEALKKQEAEFQEPETRRRWGFKGETPKEQRSLNERLTQGNPESKG